MRTKIIISRIDDPEHELLFTSLKKACHKIPELIHATLKDKPLKAGAPSITYKGWRIRRREEN